MHYEILCIMTLCIMRISTVVVRCFGKHTFIVANIQVEHSSTGMTCELLGDLFSKGSDAGMLDGDSIEGFKTVDQVNGISFFLQYAEPAQVVQRV